jgi:non-ribosomal peptide synthase protein (TIGR01720 family)
MYYGHRIQYINAYGPTETSVCAACHRVTANDSYPQGIPIGKPLCGISIFILDARLEPVPIGIPGEICISGIGLARGYHNQRQLTEQVFVTHPFLKTDPESEKRLYRSGDIGKWLPDGNILFLGRRDDQVKIRGHRIELQEIALTLRGQPGIRDAVVFVHPILNPAGLELLAYYIPQSAGKIAKMEVEAGQLACPDSVASTLSESVLKQALSRQLPAYMVPSHIISVESFPLTANGKIDRQALPDPWQETGSNAVQAPPEGTTGILIQIWRQVLGRDHIELNDNFFALGGDSIKAIQVSARLHERHLHLQVADIYRFPSIDELVGLIQAASSDINAEPAWGQTRLTPIQSWFFDTFSDHSHHFNQSVLLEPTIPLKLPALKAALQSLLDHHDALRSWFSQEPNGGWFQTYEPPGMEIDIITEDWSLLSDAANPITDRFRIHIAKMQASFDLTRPPLLRVVWYKLPDGERLLIVIHHLVVDTVSWSILLEDLNASYQAVIRGQSAVLPAKTDGFKKWAERLQILASDPSFLAEIPFWRRQLELLAETNICGRQEAAIVSLGDKKTNPSTLDRPSPFRYTYQNVQTLRFQLSDDQTNVLLSQGQHIYRATAQELLLAGLATAFYNWDGRLRLSLAMEHHGREGSITGADPLRTVGWFTSLFPVTLNAEPDLYPGSQVRSVQRSLSELPGRGIGYGVLRYLGEERLRADLNTEHWPSVSFNYLGQLGLTAQQSFFRVVSEPVGPLVAPDAFRLHDLDIQAWIHQDVLHASIYFHPDQMPIDRVQNLMALYQKALMAQILDGALGVEATSTAQSRDQSPSLLSDDLRFCGLSDADLEKAMGDD